VICTNALDRSTQLIRGIAQMLEVVKIDETVLLEHLFNESEAYAGFYQ
jgi:hypothetical protein